MRKNNAHRRLRVGLARLLCSFAVCLLSAVGGATAFCQEPGQPPAADPREAQELEPTKPIERELGGGKAHTYVVKLTAGDYLSAVVDQRGVDVMVTVFGPDGAKLLEVDSPNGANGPEPVSVMADHTGEYRVEVRSLEKDAPPGRYELRVTALRPATEADRRLVRDTALFNEAMRLGREQNAESSRRAADLLEQAVASSHAAGNPEEEADMRFFLAQIYLDLGEGRQAADRLAPALEVYKANGNKERVSAIVNLLAIIAK